MHAYHVEKPDATIKSIVGACFPEYRGNKIKLSTMVPDTIRSYWDGGSKTFYVFYSLDRGDIKPVDTNHPLYERNKPVKLDKLPGRFLLVAHSIYCGKDAGITIYANSSDLAPMLPVQTDELSDDELIVLTFTASYKSSYGGISNYRFHEARNTHGITAERWEIAKAAMIDRKYLNKAGAITASGRNAIQGKAVRKY